MGDILRRRFEDRARFQFLQFLGDRRKPFGRRAGGLRRLLLARLGLGLVAIEPGAEPPLAAVEIVACLGGDPVGPAKILVALPVGRRWRLALASRGYRIEQRRQFLRACARHRGDAACGERQDEGKGQGVAHINPHLSWGSSSRDPLSRDGRDRRAACQGGTARGRRSAWPCPRPGCGTGCRKRR